MSKIVIHHIKKPSAAQVDTAVELCLKAYDTDDISVRAVIGDDPSLLDTFFLATIRAGALAGETYLAIDESGNIVGMGLWFGPGQEAFSSEEQRKLGFNDFWAKLSSEAKQWWNTVYGPQFSELVETALGPKGKLNSWYLNLLAVDPKHQRRGIATALIDSVRKEAAGSVLAVTATKDINSTIYQKLGFTLRGSMVMTCPLGKFPVYVLSQKSPS